jgi:hypothetical protein
MVVFIEYLNVFKLKKHVYVREYIEYVYYGFVYERKIYIINIIYLFYVYIWC